MEMNQIRYFLALCKEKNFTRAAGRCGVSQPSLTTAIKKLEREFGGTLFDRGRRNELTELGILVRPFLERIAWNAATAKWCADSAGSGAHARANGEANALELECGQDGQDEEAPPALRQEPIELMLLAPDPPKSLAAE
jgi:Bacterial regulatory helix-turn-helix protein, lysR family